MFAEFCSDVWHWPGVVLMGSAPGRVVYEEHIPLPHPRVMDSSEVAINQVDTLIRLPMTQLSKAYGSGITPQQLGNLINALGLGAIAVGVN